MSTTLLFAICATLVFSPFLIELVRLLVRGVPRVATRRSLPPPPDYGADFEASVHDALYGGEPRWQRLEVTSRPRPEPPAEIPPPLHPLPSGPEVAEAPKPDVAEAPAPAERSVRAA